MLSSPYEEASLGRLAFQQIVARNRLRILHPQDSEEAQRLHSMVRKVGARILRAASDYQPTGTLDWDYVIIDSDNHNAGALPANRLIFWKGIFRVAPDEQSLAAVIGHELGHIIARHPAEDRAHSQLIDMAGRVLIELVARGNPRAVDAIALIYGLGTRVGLELPFSRFQESEADRIGLILMARAGYDPRKALDVWRRMEKSAFHLEFLSTHPSHDTRIKDIENSLPEALAYYEKSREAEKTIEVASLPAAKVGEYEHRATGEISSRRPPIQSARAEGSFPTGRDKLARSEIHLEQQLAFRERTHGADHPAVANALSDLAEVYHAEGKYYEAEGLYRRALAIKQSTYGFSHPETAAVLPKLAALYHSQGETKKAERLYRQSLAITEKAFGVDDARAVSIRDALSLLDTEIKSAK